LIYASTPEKPIFNTFGVLWVPAKNGSNGYLQFYYNNAPFGGQIPWTKTPPSALSKPDPISEMPNSVTTLPNPLPTNNPDDPANWAFGVTDLYPLALAIGTGGNAFMDVQWVRVWQAK
jgi:hypothetical protein